MGGAPVPPDGAIIEGKSGLTGQTPVGTATAMEVDQNENEGELATITRNISDAGLHGGGRFLGIIQTWLKTVEYVFLHP